MMFHVFIGVCLLEVVAASTGRVWHPGTKIKEIVTREKSDLSSRVSTCTDDFTIRPLSGVCNNLDNPGWGAPLQDMRRIIDAVYDDDKGKPRLDGLPSARAVSVACFPNDSDSTLEASLNQLVMQWGQFMAHDYAGTPGTKGSGCCTGVNSSGKHPDYDSDGNCFPILIPSGDRYLNDCLPFSRSQSSPQNTSPREQFNILTSYIDASTVYGGSDEELNELRTKSGGLLKTTSGGNLLPTSEKTFCLLRNGDPKCPNAGDWRVNVFPGLTATHTLWVQQHNRLATGLGKEHPDWDDEILFEEARRIVIAAIQRITYEDWLPLILGDDFYHAFDLGTTYDYDASVNPGLYNSFATAANRFGHSQLRATYNVKGFTNLKIQDMFMDVFYANNGIKEVFEGLLKDNSQKADDKITNGLTDHLFEHVQTANGAKDLVSFNIQRGRDHGLPSYQAFRDKAMQFASDNSISITTPAVPPCASTVYSNTTSIDLYAGAMSETPVPGGLVGPTFAYIMGLQFCEIRSGDRFWYETTNTTIGFTSDQRDEISKLTLSQVICNNVGIDTIQTDAFFVTDAATNIEASCSSLGYFDFTKF
ncbi:thyroid peroxidase-like [Haliotis rubra]|uniref:thyroid peroxidase-like n=1 Tax=Haliotis rubra TaxID=36100 RepID=UPI001EE51129|nr:thyroid peroxidase-like [Haliotis rubra]